MSARRLSLCALAGLPLIAPGDDLPALLAGALREMHIVPQDGDILVVAQKIVSKAEGRIVDLADVAPSPRACLLAREVCKDARLVEVILRESSEVIRYKKDVLIVAHRLGFVMDETITRSAGAVHGQEMTPARMESIIRSIGRIPRQRTTTYGDAPDDRYAASFAPRCEAPAIIALRSSVSG